MILLMSPAKRIEVGRAGLIPFTTTPLFKDDARDLMLHITTLSIEEIVKLFGISTTWAIKVKSWAYNFLSPDSPSQAAIIAYWGTAYRELKAEEFSQADIEYSQLHLRIASGCYGLLRPLDAIRPYRMEFYTQLNGAGNGNMQQYWKEKITRELIEALKVDQEKILINLGSKETFTSFDSKRLKENASVITVAFQKITSTGLKSVTPTLAKKARGTFARYVLTNRINKVADLYSFNGSGMTWSEDDTNESTITFIHEDL